MSYVLILSNISAVLIDSFKSIEEQLLVDNDNIYFKIA